MVKEELDSERMKAELKKRLQVREEWLTAKRMFQRRPRRPTRLVRLTVTAPLKDAALGRATFTIGQERQRREEQQPNGLAIRRAPGTETLEEIIRAKALMTLLLCVVVVIWLRVLWKLSAKLREHRDSWDLLRATLAGQTGRRSERWKIAQTTSMTGLICRNGTCREENGAAGQMRETSQPEAMNQEANNSSLSFREVVGQCHGGMKNEAVENEKEGVIETTLRQQPTWTMKSTSESTKRM